MSGAAALDVGGALYLLSAIAAVALVVRYVRLPYTVALVLAGIGIALTPHAPQIALTPDLILTIFLPVLLFHGAYNLDVDSLRTNAGAVLLLAMPGVLATAALVGTAMHLFAALNWSVAVLFGAIVAATDPVAVLAVFSALGAPRRLTTIVTGESLFNDGASLVLFAAILGVATAHHFDPGATAERFVVSVAGAIAIGVVVALAGGLLLRRIEDALLETTITLVMAYGGYLLASIVGSSGPLEAVTAGLALGLRGADVMSPSTRIQARATWEFLDFLANSLLFLLMGLAVRSTAQSAASQVGFGTWRPLLIALIAILVARAIVVALARQFLAWRGQPLPPRWSVVLVWAGMRGAVSLAAALSVPFTLPERSLLIVLTFAVVLFTLLGQGVTIGPLMRRFGMAPGAETRRAAERAVVRLRAANAALRALADLGDAGAIAEPLLDELRRDYAAKRDDSQRALDRAYDADPTIAANRDRAARARLLHVERESVFDAAMHGQVSAEIEREILAEIDNELVRLDTAE